MSQSHVSQFRKKTSVNQRSPSPIGGSKDQISGQHISNQSQNYVSNLQKGKQNNESLMNSMMKDGIFDGPDIDLKKHTKFFSDVREKTAVGAKNDAALNFDLPADAPAKKPDSAEAGQAISPKPTDENLKNDADGAPPNYSFHEKTEKKAQKEDPAKAAEDAKIAQKFKDEVATKLSQLDQTVSKGPSFKEEILAIKNPENADENFYKKNLNLVLSIVTLKKVIAKLQEDNTALKKQRDEFDVRETDYLNKIRKLEATIDEYRLKEKLWNTKPSEYIKFDLDDLNLKLKSIDESLDKATGDNLQEKFLEDIVAKNKDYLQRNEENSNALKQLRENLGQLKSTLVTMNQNG